MKKKLFFMIISASLAVALFIASGELFCRLVMPLQKNRDRYMAVRSIFQLDGRNVIFDEALGYIMQPNLNTVFNNEEFRTMVSTNSAGFRDDEGSTVEPAIMLCGDSFGFGWGVNKNDGVEAELERLTGRRVLNMCVPGYGTLQELLSLMRSGSSNYLRGATAVFLIYPNDIEDTAGFSSGSVTVDERGLSYAPCSEVSFYDSIRMYANRPYRGIYGVSYMLYVIRSGTKELKTRLRQRNRGARPTAERVNGSAKYRIFGAVIEKTAGYCRENGITPLFFWIPSVRSYEDGGAVFGSDSESEVLSETKKIFATNGLKLIDLKDVLSRDDYYRLDGHLKPSGHRKMAARIAESLNDR